MSFEGQTALVTGASRGIGRAVARLLAEEGATVGVHYGRNETAARSTADGLAGSGHVLLRADLRERDAAERLVSEAISALGQVDLLVNNAGVFEAHELPTASFEEWRGAWDRTLAVNLTAPADLCYWIGRHMIDRGGGKIVNIGSRGAFRGEPDAPAYGASKAGLHALSQSLAKKLAPHGVMVYAIAPGWVDTDMAAPYADGPDGDAVRAQSPLGRFADPMEIARTVAFLCGEGTDSLTGGIVDVNGASYLRS